MKKKTKMTKKEIALQIEKTVQAIRNRLKELRSDAKDYKVPYEVKKEVIDKYTNSSGLDQGLILKVIGMQNLKHL